MIRQSRPDVKRERLESSPLASGLVTVILERSQMLAGRTLHSDFEYILSGLSPPGLDPTLLTNHSAQKRVEKPSQGLNMQYTSACKGIRCIFLRCVEPAVSGVGREYARREFSRS